MTEHQNDQHHYYSFITMSCTDCDGNVEFEFSETLGDAFAKCSECDKKFRLNIELDIKNFDEVDE